ncbi:transposase [Arthrobacter sp. ISL-5]|nr:transposase [Arthrobacter sp. ISL-5]
MTGEIHDQIQVDGIYVGSWCCLIAVAGDYVLGWQWCDTEKKAAWAALLERFPAPRVVITDGGSGIAAALSECWSETAVQRCLVHVQRNVRTYLTSRPRTDAGKALLRLGRALTRIKAPAEAAAWLAGLNDWHQQHGHLVKSPHLPHDDCHGPGVGAGEPVLVVHARQAPQGLSALGAPRPGRHPLHLPGQRIRRTGYRLDDQLDRRRNERPTPAPAAGAPGQERGTPEACHRVVPLPAQRAAPAARQAHQSPPPQSAQAQNQDPGAARPRPRPLQHRAQRRRRTLVPLRLGRTHMTRPGFTHVLSYNPVKEMWPAPSVPATSISSVELENLRVR